MDFKDIARDVAALGLPFLGAALPVPGGAALGVALASTLGVSSGKAGDVLSALTSSADAVLKAKQFEMDNYRELSIAAMQSEQALYQQEVIDRNGARSREASDTTDNTNKILAFVIVASFVAVTVATVLGYAKVDSVLAGTLVGYMSAKAEQVIAYYFGSSKSSARKTELLAQSPAIEVK